MMNIIGASRLRRSSFVSSLFIGGVDAAKYADAQGFSDNFRAQHNPANPVVIPVQNILNYSTQPDGNGRLNISAEIAGNFVIPDQVFDNNISDSGSRITYFVDSQGLATELGSKLFDKNPGFKYLITNTITTISGFWLSFTIADVPRVLNFEDAINIEDSAFINYRNPNDRINIRNATNITADPATDAVFNNYNLNNRTEPKKVIYVHPSLETINNGSPLNSLQSAITRGADVRYVINKNLPSNFQRGDVIISEIGATYLDFTITTPASSNNIDYYDVFILDTSNSTDVIRRFFAFQEITDTNTLLTGLEVNKNYKVEIQAVDVFFNKNERFNLGNVTTTFNISQNEIGGTYVLLDENYISPIETKTVDVYVNGVLNSTITEASKGNVYAFNLSELTNYDIYLVIEGNQSNTINVTTTTIDTQSLFQNAVAYFNLDETSGNAIDVVNSYNGTLFGGVTQGVSGKIETAYSFDGVDGRVDLPTSIYNDFNVSNYTLSLWVYVRNVSDVQVVLTQEVSDVTVRGLSLFIINSEFSFRFSDNGNQVFLDSSTLNVNTWYHCILKLNFNSIAEFKLNNISQGTHTFVNAPTFTQSQIKIGNRNSPIPLDGIIDEVSFINGQTTAAQDSDLYNNGSGTTI